MVEGKGGEYVCKERRGLRGKEGAYCVGKETEFTYVCVNIKR